MNQLFSSQTSPNSGTEQELLYGCERSNDTAFENKICSVLSPLWEDSYDGNWPDLWQTCEEGNRASTYLIFICFDQFIRLLYNCWYSVASLGILDSNESVRSCTHRVDLKWGKLQMKTTKMELNRTLKRKEFFCRRHVQRIFEFCFLIFISLLLLQIFWLIDWWIYLKCPLCIWDTEAILAMNCKCK